jgi:hypothetical protein
MTRDRKDRCPASTDGYEAELVASQEAAPVGLARAVVVLPGRSGPPELPPSTPLLGRLRLLGEF